ncbi:MAG: SDR family NAD(P)-dependent oxidoreductase [Anaerolineaceae bacterium]|nr:SDR family NAD(P)-dependent oxidoreductase [Anaerolineaceae bacterium]
MKAFKGKTAVITGSANGIGRSIAEKCVAEEMNVVLADIDEQRLNEVQAELQAAGGSVLAIRTDVSRHEDIEALAQAALSKFGKIHLLCNNAGLSTYKRSWKMTLSDWNWVVGVNLWGVIYGIQVFLPIMLEQDEEAYIINTASEAGIIGGRRNMSGYYLTKSGVIALSESLYHELAETTPKIKAAVFIPGLVRANSWNPERYRPSRLQNEEEDRETMARYEKFMRGGQMLFESDRAMGASQAADILFQGIREEKFYIRTHPGTKDELIRAHTEDILAGHNPVDRIPAYRNKLTAKENLSKGN